MSRIFDNITVKFEDGPRAILSNPGVQRADFCVGYFILRRCDKLGAGEE